MTDLVKTSKRPDISTADADCITSTTAIHRHDKQSSQFDPGALVGAAEAAA
jgi:hypothetical protein